MADFSDLPPDRRAPMSADDPNAGDEETIGEYVSLPPLGDDDYVSEEDGEGGLIVTIGQPYEAPHEEGGFYENLANILPDHILDRVATELLRNIEEDKQAREKGDKLYEEGLRRTGLGNDAPGGAEFEGASKVVHPLMTEACIDYEARIIKELWPISGPVREKIVGVPTQEKADRAKRKTEFMNFQLTTQIKEARATMETTLTQVPLGGVQYVKQWWDHRIKRPRWQFVARDNAYLPANAEGWYSAQRRTFSDKISAVTLKERVDSGMYRDWNLPKSSSDPEVSKTEQANRKIEGLEPTGLNVDGDREVYETMSYLEITSEIAEILQHEEGGDMYPYLITIDLQSKKVLALYRDWEEKDETREPIDHIFEFPFIPWRGAYAIGLPQIIGGLSGAATGSLRALLDSAMIANTQGGLILKGTGTGSQTKRPNFGEFTEIDGGGLATPDIRQKVMQFETKEPSTVLFQLLGFLVEAGKGAVRTSLDEMNQDGNPNVPVGTQLSRVEEGLVVFSAIHGRVHEAFDRLLAGLHRLNRLYLPKTLKVDAAGKEIMVRQSDFEGPPDVQPVSDPTIYSDQQRMAQIQAIQGRAAIVPGLYNARKVEERFLKLIKIADGDSLLNPVQEPHELNAVNENVSMGLGKPVQAFPEQDHIAHIQTHLSFMASPTFGFNPLIAPKFLQPCLDHVVQHMLFAYAAMNNDLVSGAANRRAVDLMSTDVHVKQAFDKLLAVASAHVVPRADQMYQQISGPIQQALAMLKAMAPPPPQDPATAALAAAQAETARRGQNDQGQLALAAAKLKEQSQSDQVKNAALLQRNQITQQTAEQRAQADLQRTEMETNAARDVAAMRIESGQGGHYSDGASLGA